MTVNLYNGNCLDVLKTLEENSIDACVTDPPYGLSFMGKSWDYDVPKAELWKEVYRVLKPGAHILAFFGSRTYHRGVVQIEDAGFEIRDQIMWVYGSGFPKSHNISKAIDAKIINNSSRPEDIRKISMGDDYIPSNRNRKNYDHGCASKRNGIETNTIWTDEAKQWEGWGTALKPAHEPIVLARKPIKTSVAENVLEYGTGALNIDATRISGAKRDPGFKKPDSKGMWGQTSQITDWVDADKGRWPANFIHDDSEEVVELFPDTASGGLTPEMNVKATTGWSGGSKANRVKNVFPANSGSAARFFYCAKASKRDRDEGLETEEQSIVTFQTGNGTSGKASSISTDRNTSYKNNHPTVKPTELMRYLCRLITPPNGVIIDPFMGSGSTGKAARLENFGFVGIELDENYCRIAEQRIENVKIKSTLNKYLE